MLASLGLFLFTPSQFLNVDASLGSELHATFIASTDLKQALARLVIVLHHIHRIVLEQGRIGDDGDVHPVALFGEIFCEWFELQVRLLDLSIMLSITHAMFDASEVAVECLAAVGLANLVE